MSTWLVVADDLAVGALTEVAGDLGGPVTALVVGSRTLAEAVAAAGGVDRVDWFETRADVPVPGWAAAVAEHVAGAMGRGAPVDGAGPDALGTGAGHVVLSGTGAGSRVVAGAIAGAWRSPVLAGVRKVVRGVDGLLVDRLVSGGIALERDLVRGAVVLVLEGGRWIEPDSGRPPAPVRTVLARPAPVTTTGTPGTGPADRDLAAASRVVGVGRGLPDRAYLGRVDELARLLGAQVACSRPVAEDLGWLPRDRYLGVSGRKIAPRLYLALGISGQLQHLIGVRDAGTIAAVTTDPQAPVIEGADLTVIGDLRQIVPALVAELERRR